VIVRNGSDAPAGATPGPDGPEEAADAVPSGAADFSAAVAALSSAFGDPTRRALYLHLRDHPHATVTELADAFGLHPNVVRHHLDRLVAGGHVEVEAPRKATGAGRPAKRFVCAANDLTLEVGSRRDELLVALIERSLDLLGPEKAELMATQVGHDYGVTLAARMGPTEAPRSVASAMGAVAEALTAHGFAAHTDLSGPEPAVVSDTCPFGEAAAHHPVLCAVDRGIVAGLLEGLGAVTASTSVQLSSRARGDADCRATA